MPKSIKPVTLRSATARRAAIAYRDYSQKALLRFDLEGRVETMRQQRAGLSLNEAVDDQRVTEHVRSKMREERTH